MASEELDQLIANLKRLHLRHAAARLDEHLQDARQLKLGHLGFLARVVEAEVLARNETGTQKRIDRAGFPEQCRLEDYDFKAQPTLDRQAVVDLAELGFIDRCEPVLWIGPSGVGKTHLAIALGVRACEAGYNARYVRACQLMRELYAALADDTLDERLEEYEHPNVLIVDELGNSPRPDGHDYSGVLFELVARRHRRGAIVITTNFGFDEWAEHIGLHLTPAIDRLVESAHIFTFPADAPSYRASRTQPPGPLPPLKKRRRKPTTAAPQPRGRGRGR